MPVEACRGEDGRPGFRCGGEDAGTSCYTYDPGDEETRAEARRRAVAQCVAIGELPHVSAADLTRLARRGAARVDELEDRLAALLEPILNRAGDRAARRFREQATDFLRAALTAGDLAALNRVGASGRRLLTRSLTLTAAAGNGRTMVALYPRPEEAEALVTDGDHSAGRLHVTLAFLGDTDEDTLQQVSGAVKTVAGSHAPLEGTVGGVAAFGGDEEGAPAVLLPDVPGLVELRVAVCQALAEAGVGYSREHGYTAHATVGRHPRPQPPEADKIGLPLHFDAVYIVRDDGRSEPIPLVGPPPLTAAAAWAAPAANELIDVDALVAELRGKTDPVRRAVAETMMVDALNGVGLSFDVTNPYAGKVLAGSAAQITFIAETTRLNAMRVIRRSYEEGLSIPDTAKAIRAGMREATPARARLIARTELAGVANGSSLAAAKIVANATGQTYWKRWLTASGAKHPRHHPVPGLNGQTVGLDDYFTVRGHKLEHPADPAGPPSDVCNCRCSISYSEEPPG